MKVKSILSITIVSFVLTFIFIFVYFAFLDDYSIFSLIDKSSLNLFFYIWLIGYFFVVGCFSFVLSFLYFPFLTVPFILLYEFFFEIKNRIQKITHPKNNCENFLGAFRPPFFILISYRNSNTFDIHWLLNSTKH